MLQRTMEAFLLSVLIDLVVMFVLVYKKNI